MINIFTHAGHRWFIEFLILQKYLYFIGKKEKYEHEEQMAGENVDWKNISRLRFSFFLILVNYAKCTLQPSRVFPI